MYYALLCIHALGIIVSLISTYKLVTTKYITNFRFLLLTSVCADVYSIGYFAEMLSTSKSMAQGALMAEYIGLAYMSLCFFMFVAEFCGVKPFPKFLRTLLYAFNTFIIALVIFMDRNTLYYKTVDFVHDGLFPHLVTSSGVFYYVFALEEYLLMIICAVLLYQKRKKESNKSRKHTYSLVLFESLLPLFGIAINVLRLINGYDCGPIMATIMIPALLLTLLNGKLFDIVTAAYANIFQNMGSGIIVVDNEKNFLSANLFAYTIFPEFQTWQIRTPIDRLHIDLCNGVNDFYFEKGGVFYGSNCTRLFDKGNHVGYIITINDVTEMRERIEEMELLKNEADSANKAKSAFLATMSHEIRTPLNAIIGMAELSEREKSMEVIMDYLSQIKASGNMLLDIVTEVLDISKAESGKLELVPVEFSTEYLLNAVINVTNMRIGDKPIDFLVDIDPKLPTTLYGDDVRIRQVLLNFLGNAEKYTNAGHVKLRIDYSKENERARILCAVSDTGRGIMPEDQEKLFKPFSRVDEKNNRNITGTGLGLSIAAQLIGLMGGSYRVESTYGKGSTFYFDFLVDVVNEKQISARVERKCDQVPKFATYSINYEEKTVESQKKPNEEKSEPKFEDAKVLVVDDNRVNLKVLTAFLKHFDITADTAENGQRAIEMSEKKEYDLIFMDHMMPGMDGVEATEILRKSEASNCKTVKIIACTANVIKGIENTFYDAGMDDFIPKPIQMENLREKLLQHLNDKLK